MNILFPFIYLFIVRERHTSTEKQRHTHTEKQRERHRETDTERHTQRRQREGQTTALTGWSPPCSVWVLGLRLGNKHLTFSVISTLTTVL